MTADRHWSARYVGLPWCEKGRSTAGVDCWGLIFLVYGAELGIALPSYGSVYTCTAERAEIAAAITKHTSAGWFWGVVEPSAVRPFDVALFRRGALQSHVGVIVGGGRMLHIDEGRESCLEPYTSGRLWPRLVAIYRHAHA